MSKKRENESKMDSEKKRNKNKMRWPRRRMAFMTICLEEEILFRCRSSSKNTMKERKAKVSQKHDTCQLLYMDMRKKNEGVNGEEGMRINWQME